MKKAIYTGIAVVLVIGGLFIFNSSKGASADTIRIGLISSETGDFATVGSDYAEGARYAYEEYKASHPNSNIELYSEDDGTDSKKALSAYTKLTSLNKVDALINFSSPSINIIYNSVSKLGIPVIQLGEQDIAPAADSVYQIYPTQDAPEVAVGEYVKSISNGNDTVLFYTNDSTVVKFVGNIKKGFGEEFAGEFKLDLSQKEYATIVTKAMALNPKFAVMSAFPQNGERVLQQLLKYKNRPTIIFDLTFDSTEYKGVFPDLSVLDGTKVMSLKHNLDADFAAKYKARYNKDATIFTGYGYDAFNTLIASYDKNESKWNTNVGAVNFKGVTGQIFFNDKGLRKPEFEIKTIKNGVLVGESQS